MKGNQKQNFDSRCGVRDLSELEEGELVWIPDRQTETVVQEEVTPRSYNVSTPDGTVRHNRRNLAQMSESNTTSEIEAPETVETTNKPTVHQSTQVSHPLERLELSWTQLLFEKGRCGISYLCKNYATLLYMYYVILRNVYDVMCIE